MVYEDIYQEDIFFFVSFYRTIKKISLQKTKQFYAKALANGFNVSSGHPRKTTHLKLRIYLATSSPSYKQEETSIQVHYSFIEKYQNRAIPQIRDLNLDSLI